MSINNGIIEIHSHRFKKYQQITRWFVICIQ